MGAAQERSCDVHKLGVEASAVDAACVGKKVEPANDDQIEIVDLRRADRRGPVTELTADYT